ncbi:MAG: hypothetical protein V1855_01125 [bacterium]
MVNKIQTENTGILLIKDKNRLPDGFFMVELALAMALFVVFLHGISMLQGYLYKTHRAILKRTQCMQAVYQGVQQGVLEGPSKQGQISIEKIPMQCIFVPKNQATMQVCNDSPLSCVFLIKRATIKQEKGSTQYIFLEG